MTEPATQETRIVVTGASGMLGQAVMRVLAARRALRVTAADRRALDAESPDAERRVEEFFDVFRPDYVVNCAGVLKAEIDRGSDAATLRAIRVNSVFPRLLADAAARHDSRVIHMSTDGVFSGVLPRSYLESDPADPADAYGRTKALGEARDGPVVNVRCSIVGRDPVRGRGLLEWFLRLPEGATVSGFRDQQWNGVTTVQFADWCAEVILGNHFDDIRREGAVVHLCPNPALTKYELLRLWRAVTGKNVAIVPADSGQAGRTLGSELREWRRACANPPSWEELLRRTALPAEAPPGSAGEIL